MTVRELVVFDLDGVLVDTRRLHFVALNLALAEHGLAQLSWEWHEANLDGLPTRVKLERIGAPPEANATKQRHTVRLLADLPPDPTKQALFAVLRESGWLIGVASNAVRDTVHTCLDRIGVTPDVVVSNEDVAYPKPNPACYLQAMAAAGVGPKLTAVVEDRDIGVQSALAAGVRSVVQVEGTGDVTSEHLGSGGWRWAPLRRRGLHRSQAVHRLWWPADDRPGGREPAVGHADRLPYA